MPQLSHDPKDHDLEDYIAAHLLSRGCYVETGIKERNPDELLELDIVWTNYRINPIVSHPVEVKSKQWHVSDIYKFYGWTNSIGIDPGQFVYRQPCGRIEPESLLHVQNKTNISLHYLSNPKEGVEQYLCSFGLSMPSSDWLPELWRYSLLSQKRLLKTLNISIGNNYCVESSKAAKEYWHLINNAVFFIPDKCERIRALLKAHFDHRQLAKSAAYEIESGIVDFASPPNTDTLKRAIYNGGYYTVQACLYLEHRARLYLIKALVDYWLGCESGEIKPTSVRFGDTLVDLTMGGISSSMASGIEELSALPSFRLFPVFWQVFLWSFGGFICTDQKDVEYDDLSKETGVPLEEIPAALSAFNKLFPIPGGWLRDVASDSRQMVILMPPVMRGIGALRRKERRSVQHYKDLGYKDNTANHMSSDNNSCVRILDCLDADLIR